MIIETILFLPLDWTHAKQVCCKVGIIEGLYSFVALFALGL